MSHAKCKKCGSREHYSGYGLATGRGIGAYTICECGEVLEFVPDRDGLDEDSPREKAREAFWTEYSVHQSPDGEVCTEAGLSAALSAFESSLLEDLIAKAEREAEERRKAHKGSYIGMVDDERLTAATWAATWIKRQLPSPPLKEDQPAE